LRLQVAMQDSVRMTVQKASIQLMSKSL
jgi:hypothetical protein